MRARTSLFILPLLFAAAVAAYVPQAPALPREVPPACEVALFSRLTQLTVHAFEKKQLTLEDLESMMNSVTPLNPTESLTGDSSNSALKRVFAENIRVTDADAWSKVRAELALYIPTVKARQDRREDARQATEGLFHPRAVKIVSKPGPSDNPMSLFSAEDGAPVGIQITSGPNPKGALTPAFLYAHDFATGDTSNIFIGDHWGKSYSIDRLPKGRVLLAAQKSARLLRIVAYPNGQDSFELPLTVDGNDDIEGTADPKPGDLAPSNFLHSRTGEIFVATHNTRSVQLFNLSKRQDPPLVVPFAGPRHFVRIRLFESSTGRRLMAFSTDQRELFVYDFTKGSPRELMKIDAPGLVSSHEWHEAESGEVFLSAASSGTYYVYQPLLSREPYYQEKLAPAVTDVNFWFTDANGDSYNYVMSWKTVNQEPHSVVSVFNVTQKQIVYSAEDKRFAGGSPFLTTEHGDPRLVITSRDGLSLFVINPLRTGSQPIEFKLTQPLDGSHAIYPQKLATYIDGEGNQGLAVNGYRRLTLFKLTNPPSGNR